MPSEYDFLLPYSRRLRRIGSMLGVAAAFIAGFGCAALIVALPLRSVVHDGKDKDATAATTQAADKGKAPGEAGKAEAKPPAATAAADKPAERKGEATGASAGDDKAVPSPRETTGVAGQPTKTADTAAAPAHDTTPTAATPPTSGNVTQTPTRSASTGSEKSAANPGQPIADSQAGGTRASARGDRTHSFERQRSFRRTARTRGEEWRNARRSASERRAARTRDDAWGNARPDAWGSAQPAEEQQRPWLTRGQDSANAGQAGEKRQSAARTREARTREWDNGWQSDEDQPRSARARGDDRANARSGERRRYARDRAAEDHGNRDYGREFVDENGVRTIILPRRSTRADDVQPVVRQRRVIVAPSWGFFDGDN